MEERPLDFYAYEDTVHAWVAEGMPRLAYLQQFSSKDTTWQGSYDSVRNLTVVSASFMRLGEQGIVSIKFDHPPATLEVWVNSNEKGDYEIASLGQPFPTPSILNSLAFFSDQFQFKSTCSLLWLGVGHLLLRRRMNIRF